MSVSEGGDTRADGPDESVMSADMENDDDEVCAHCEQRFVEQDEEKSRVLSGSLIHPQHR